MARTVCLGLLAILLGVVVALYLRLAATTIQFVSHPESVHYRLPVSDTLIVSVDQFGELRRGDRLVAVDGARVHSRGQVHRALIRRPMGPPVPLTVERQGQEMDVTAPTRPFPSPIGLREKIWAVVQNIVVPWFCILLGFFIVYRLPTDRMAWLVLLILLAQSAFNSFLFQVDGWPPFWSGLMRFSNRGIGQISAAAWLWFGLDFGAERNPRRLLAWLRWPLTVSVIWLATVSTWVVLMGAEYPAWLGGWKELQLPETWNAAILYSAMALGVANLFYRLAGETDPDTRRRLRLLVVGLLLGRGPLLAMEVANTAAGFSFNAFPTVTWIAFSMLALVPLTFAYVLIVERAMDVGVVVRQGLQYAFARRSVDILRVALALVPLVLVENRWAAIGWALLAVALVGPLARHLHGAIDRRFFREAVQAERVLAGTGELLRTITEPEGVVTAVARHISATLHVPEVRFWLEGATPAPQWLAEREAESLFLPIRGRNGLLGGLHLGPKKSQEVYSPAEKQLLESVAHQAGLAIENAQLTNRVAEEAVQRERIQRELQIAKDVQARLLPKRDPEMAGFTISGVCRPAQSIGGDSYDYIVTGDRLLLTIADVAGKGVPAALLMSNLQAGLRGLAFARTEESLAEMLSRLNGLVFESTPANRFITLFALTCFQDSRRVVYASAGHNPAALWRAGASGVEWIRTKGLALGLKRQAAFTEGELELASGDLVVLYTDGVTEAMNPGGEEFGEERLARAIGAGLARSVQDLRDGLVRAVDEFAAGAPQHDDITLVVLRVE
ncbi:MAG: SpoIIE family protein phosphatase [Paludibaculum sp.]